MINAIIVDDEPLALDILESYIEKIPNVNLIQRCESAVEAFEIVRSGEVDLMFLDIQMPQMTGIEFLKSLKNPPLVVFTTAYSEYALDGYDLNVLDYLLKPIPFDRFITAVNKAFDLLEPAETSVTAGDDSKDFIFVKSDKKLMKVRYSDILYIEGLKDYVIIRMEGNARVITLQTMKSLEAKMPHDQFKRIHRSYIVALDKIEAIMGNMVEINKKHLPIGKNYREELLKIVNDNRL